MRKIRSLMLLTVVALALVPGAAAAATTERVSVDSVENEATGGAAFNPAVSSDGRFVAFDSSADNLVAGDTNGLNDIFVRDRSLGTTERVNVDSAEAEATGGVNGSSSPAISVDGRFVAFNSDADNLVAGDTNGLNDIFVRDRTLGTTERISVDSAEAEATDGASNSRSAISADGRFVAFASAATNLVSGDDNGLADIFVRDRTLGTTERVSVDSAEAEATGGNSVDAAISADGRFVAFDSAADNLVGGDINGQTDIFLRDRTLGTTERVNVDSAEAEATSFSFGPDISADGRFVAFTSGAENLVGGDTNGVTDIFVRDRTLGTTERVSVDSAEAEATGDGSSSAAVSANGRFVAFRSEATDLVGDDTNNETDMFVRDRSLGTTERVSVDSDGVEALGGGSDDPAISADGRFVAFDSAATNLVGDDANGFTDIFVRERPPAGTTERASVDGAEAQAVGGVAFRPAISADGRFVAFQSEAINLVSGDNNALRDIFVRDRSLGTTERASVDSAEAEATGGISRNAAISADGRFVAFRSDADNLVAGDNNGVADIFVRDRSLGTTERVSVDSAEVETTVGISREPAISADGRFVAFDSDADNLVAGDTNGVADIFVRDRTLGTTERVSLDSTETEATDGGSGDAAISPDGRFVAFHSDAINLVGSDNNSVTDIFVRDRSLGTTERVNVDSSEGEATNQGSEAPAISADGRFVAFTSGADNLVAGDTNGLFDIFVRDRSLGATKRISLDSAGDQSTGDAVRPAISADGRFVAFYSDAINLVSGDTNEFRDIFVRDRLLGITERVSVDQAGAQATGDSEDPAISADGRFVAFNSLADNLVSDDTNVLSDIFVRSVATDVDSDGDGYTDEDELSIGTHSAYPCGNGGWPSDLLSTGPSANKLDVQDIISFIAPLRRLDTSPGTTSNYLARWDLAPGANTPFPSFISIFDITTMLNGTPGSPAYPPMFAGPRAFGRVCPASPQ